MKRRDSQFDFRRSWTRRSIRGLNLRDLSPQQEIRLSLLVLNIVMAGALIAVALLGNPIAIVLLTALMIVSLLVTIDIEMKL